MVSDRKIKAFEKFIDKEYNKKLESINKNHPLEDDTPTAIIKSGKGKLRSSVVLRDMIKNGKTHYNNELYVSEVFDIEEDLKIIQESNKKIQSLINQMKAALSLERDTLIKYVYFSTESELMEKLEQFEKIDEDDLL